MRAAIARLARIRQAMSRRWAVNALRPLEQLVYRRKVPWQKQRRLPLEASHPTGVGRQTRPVLLRRGDYGPRSRGTQPTTPSITQQTYHSAEGLRALLHATHWRTNMRPRGTARFRRMCLPRAEFKRGDATVILRRKRAMGCIEQQTTALHYTRRPGQRPPARMRNPVTLQTGSCLPVGHPPGSFGHQTVLKS